jgi:hypothetical protein
MLNGQIPQIKKYTMGNSTSTRTTENRTLSDKDWGANEIIPRLYLGSAWAADNKHMLDVKGITHIITIAQYDFIKI